VGSGSDTKGRNFLLLARTTRETLSARAALHAGTWTEMARKAWSFWLSKRLHCPKSIPLSALDQKQGYAVHDPMSAKSQKRPFYSMTSSARFWTDCGTVMPSALAVLRLMTSSIFMAAAPEDFPAFRLFANLTRRFGKAAAVTHQAARCPLRAKADIPYSITSSARASTDGGILRPSALAVVRLITSSNLVGCSTGMSAGLVPRSILSTKSAECRNSSE
jgi:hypothetical protein